MATEQPPNANLALSQATNNADDDDLLNLLTVDCLVDVEDRMWPGMNKQGGIARVKAIDTAKRTVNLHYVVDRRKEKDVAISFVTLAPQYDVQQPSSSSQAAQQSNLRDRSMLLGRCKLCGSLRTDCGSCDWVEEERRLHELHDKNNDTEKSGVPVATTSSSRPTRKKSSSKVPKNKQTTESSIFESSDEEIEGVIRQLQREMRSSRRRRAKLEREWQKYLEDVREENSQAISRAKARQKDQNKSSTVLASTILSDGEDEGNDSDAFCSSDEDNLPLFGSKRRRLEKMKERYVKNSRRKRKSRYSLSRGSHNLMEPQGEISPRPHTSVLESLSEVENWHREHQHLSGSPKESIEDGQRTMDGDSTSEKLRSPPPNSSNHGVANKNQEVSSSFPIDFDDDVTDDNINANHRCDTTSDDEPLLDEDSRGYFDTASSAQNDLRYRSGSNAGMSREALGLKEFIQPEGEEVAENLPEDTIDRASKVAYKELPRFFDNEAQLLEDELLPNAKLEIANLEQRINSWKIERVEAANSSNTNRGQGLWKESVDIMNNLVTTVIRNGIDQCRSALRQLLDDRRYRKERRNLSVIERKAIRRERELLILSRDARMEELDRQATALEKKIERAQFALGGAGDIEGEDMVVGDESSSNSTDIDSQHDAMNIDSDDQSDDNVVLNQLATATHTSYSTNRDRLSPWDRHKHARRVRPSSSQAQEQYYGEKKNRHHKPNKHRRHGSRKRTPANAKTAFSESLRRACGKTKRDGNDTLRLQQQHDSTSEDNDENTPENLSYPRHPNKACKHNKTLACNQPPRNGSKGGSSVTATRTVLKETDISKLSARADSDSNDDAAAYDDKSGESLDEDNEAPLLEDILPLESAPGSLTEDSRQCRRQNFHQRVISHSMDNRKPIADRMQAFLDANPDLGGYESHEDDDISAIYSHSAAHSRSQAVSYHRSSEQQRRRSKKSYHEIAGSKRRRRGLLGNETGTRPLGRRTERTSDVERDNTLIERSESNNDLDVSSISAEQLFTRLRYRLPTASHAGAIQPTPTAPDPSPDLSELCESIISIAGPNNTGPFIRTLEAMTSRALAQVSAGSPQGHTAATLVFPTLLKVLQRQEATLQELVSRGDHGQLKCQVKLLSVLLELIEKGANSSLTPDDGLVFQIFSTTHQNRLVKFLVLQLVDSVYALVHPLAWALPFGKLQQHRTLFMNTFAPLCEALGKLTFLTEMACHCIATQMERQTWRLVDYPTKHAFVSSVAPDSWTQFLQSGGVTQKLCGKYETWPTMFQSFEF
jgi:hypothetical protein